MAWQKLATNTLTGTGDTLSTGAFIPITFINYFAHLLNSGNVEPQVHDDGVTTTSYSFRSSNNGGADGPGSNRTNIRIINGVSDSVFVIGYMINIATEEKLHMHCVIEDATVGAASAPDREEVVGKYAQTSTQIAELDTNNIGAGDLLIDSNISALGSD